MSYNSPQTKAAKLRLAISYNDNSRRAVPHRILTHSAELGLDDLLDHYMEIDRILKSSLAGHDALLDEME